MRVVVAVEALSGIETDSEGAVVHFRARNMVVADALHGDSIELRMSVEQVDDLVHDLLLFVLETREYVIPEEDDE